MSLLKQDLEQLAQERLKEQELASAEQLVALRDGELDERQADQVRLQMAADPELAEVYLSLCRVAEDAESANVPEEQIDQGLQALMDRVGAKEPGNVLPLERRNRSYVWVGWAAVAATLLLVFGLRMQQPDGPYFPVEVSSEALRSSIDVELPNDHLGLELILSAEFLRSLDLESFSAIDIRLETLGGKAVAGASSVSMSELPVSWKVGRQSLMDDRTYELKLREAGQEAWPANGWSFELRFIPPPAPSP